MRTAVTSLALLVAAVMPATAQYDRDGRYVVSPNGVPLDPNARPIPLYPGTPGGAIGTPSPARPPTLILPDVSRPVSSEPLPTYRVPLTVKRCRMGWTPETGTGRGEFARRCKRVLAAERPAF
jgi:hypothetical protein